MQKVDPLLSHYDIIIAPPETGDQLAITNLTGHPSVTLPLGMKKNGMPGSISFIASNTDRHQCLVVLHNIKCNPFNDLNALSILNGQPLNYHVPLAFVYAHDLYTRGREYADDRFEHGMRHERHKMPCRDGNDNVH